MICRDVLLLLLSMTVLTLRPQGCPAAEVVSPEKFLGHPVAADYKLARWEQIQEYFRLLDAASPRVRVRTVGQTTEGVPLILAEISAAETVDKLDQHQQNQQRVADPRRIKDEAEEAKLAAESKVVVLINCNLHSSEIASSQLSMELAYELATADDPRTREILDRTILLLVPSANPDGVNKIVDWYERSRNQPWEGIGMPWLYQKYAGHDNNRDWFMLALKETRLLTQVLYHEWFPTIVYDIHQMGNNDVRFFVPPFFDPKNANVHPLIDQSLMVVGGHMAADLAQAGKKGVIHGAFFDNWWAGGFRATSQRHNMVGLLTEAASPLVASPIFQRKSDLKGGGRGLPQYAMTTNFPDPWPGGWWRLRDVADYEKIACYSLLTLASRYHDRFQGNYIRLGREAIERGKNEPPFAWLVPPDQRDPGAAAHLLETLQYSGIEIHQAGKPFTADNVSYPAGTHIMYCAQPYRMHLNDLMELQFYPERARYPGGPAETPYDIAGWTLPVQMGVRHVAVSEHFDCEAPLLDKPPVAKANISGADEPESYIVAAGANDDFRLMNRLHKNRISFSIVEKEQRWKAAELANLPRGSLVVADAQQFKSNDGLLAGLGCRLIGVTDSDAATAKSLATVKQPRLALYQPWTASMDEGWTRWVLDHFEYPYTTVHNAEIRAGNLAERYDCLVLPSISTETIMNGHEPDTTAPEYVGGLSRPGVLAIQQFLEAGGTLVCLDDACNFPIDELNIPVKNLLAGKKREDFYCPGSILRVVIDPRHALGYGLPTTIPAYFIRSQAFEVETSQRAASRYRTTVVGRYADSLLLLSGFLKGGELIEDKPAIVEVRYGRGQIVLLGFRVQHRAQPHGTFRLLFNAIQRSVLE